MQEIEQLKSEIERLNKRVGYLESEVIRLKNRNAGRKKKVLSESEIELIKLYRINNMSIREIAKIFNVSTTVICNVIKNNYLIKR